MVRKGILSFVTRVGSFGAGVRSLGLIGSLPVRAGGCSFANAVRRGALRLPVRYPLLVIVAGWGCLAGTVARAQAPVLLVSNMAQTSSDPASGDNPLDAYQGWTLGVPFTTGSSESDWLLSAVDLDVESWPSGTTPTVSIYTTDSNLPLTSLATLVNPSRGTGTRTFSASPAVSLEPNTGYAVVVESSAPALASAFRIAGTLSDAEDAGGQPGWSVQDERTWLSQDGNWGFYLDSIAKLALRGHGEGIGQEGDPEPTGTLRMCGSRLGSLEPYKREAELDICWERPDAVPSSSRVVIEKRWMPFWDYPEAFSRWAEVGRGDSFTSCTGGTACVQFTEAELFRGQWLTYEMRIRLGDTVLALSPQLEAQAPNGDASLLEASLSKAVDEDNWHAIDRATGPFVVELFFTDPNVESLMTEPVQGLETADFDVTNGSVTAVEVWNGGTYKVRVTPATLGQPVTIRLRADTVMGVGEALTESGERSYTRNNTASNLVTQPTAAPGRRGTRSVGGGLTAHIETAPWSHDGATRFDLRIAFSVPIRNGYKEVRNHAVQVSGGRVVNAHRIKRRSDLWKISIAPSGFGPVTVTLTGGGTCGSKGILCAADGRALSRTLTHTIPGPVAISVADADAREGTDSAIVFVVSLDRTPFAPVTVDYATRDGSARAGEDYTETSGTLTFAPRVTEKSVSVPVLDDAKDEDAEIFTLVLSNALGARIADDEATGTIRNHDPLQKAWLARFGRTVAVQAVDAVAARLDGGGGTHVTVGGIALGGVPGAGRDIEAWADREVRPTWRRRGDDDVARSRAMTKRALLSGSAFLWSVGGAVGAPHVNAWGRVATGGFDAGEDGVRIEGDVITGFLGADVVAGRWLGGLALSASEGEGAFRLTGESASNRSRGTVESSLTALYPYARLRASERLDLWAMAGVGQGRMTIAEEGGTPIATDIGMTMGAAGARGRLLEPAAEGGLALALKSDLLVVRTESDEVEGGAGRLASARADVSRMRLVLEGSRAFESDSGGRLVPSAEIGVRHDAGDAETGTGIELGGGLRYSVARLTVEGAARSLVAHEASAREEWGVSGSVRIDPGGSGRGLSLALSPAWGRAQSGTERLWSMPTAAELAAGGEFEAGPRVGAELGYGMRPPAGRGVLTPYTGLSMDDDDRTWRLGARWRDAPAFGMALEFSHRQGDEVEEHTSAATLRATFRW